MTKLCAQVGLMFLSTIATEGAGEVRAVVIYDGAVAKLATRSPWAHSKNLDVIPALKRKGVTEERLKEKLVENPRKFFERQGAS